jgi:hypothetical protein
MKNRKVLNLRTHVGGLHGKTSYDASQHECDMELWPVGVLLKSIKGRVVNTLIPFANVVEVILAPEAIEADQATEETKRGPGRPKLAPAG